MSYASAIAALASRGNSSRTFVPMVAPHNGRALALSNIIGAHVLQTPGAIQAEMSQIHGDILAFGKELNDYVLSIPGFPHNPPTAIEAYYESVWSPFVQNWMAWYDRNNGWFGNLWWNHAPEAEEYLKQLLDLRARAESLGIPVHSPQPAKPPMGLESQIWSVVKAMLWVGLGILTFGLIVQMVRK